jgi:hypothetical protein
MIQESHDKLRPVLERRDHGFRWRGRDVSRNIYFRRYSLDDRVSFLLNAALLVVVAFYVYPLKFLTTLLTNALTRYQEVDAAGNAIHAMRETDWKPLMMIYSAGFVALYVIFALMYLHAYKLRDALELNAMETYETRGVVTENLMMVGIGTGAFALAWLNRPQFSGMLYFLIGPSQWWLGSVHGKGRKRLMVLDQG